MTGIERQGGRVSAVVTSQEERIPVDKTLFLLANSAVPGLLQDHFGVRLPVWVRLPQVDSDGSSGSTAFAASDRPCAPAACT